MAEPFEMPHRQIPFTPGLPEDAVAPGVEVTEIGRLDDFNVVESWVCGAIKRAIKVPYATDIGPLHLETAIAAEPIKSVMMDRGAGYGVIRNGRALVMPLDIKTPETWRGSPSIVRAIRAGNLTDESVGLSVLYFCDVRARSARAGTLIQEALYTTRTFGESAETSWSYLHSGALLRGLAKAVRSVDIDAVVAERIAASRRTAWWVAGGHLWKPAQGGLPGSSRRRRQKGDK